MDAVQEMIALKEEVQSMRHDVLSRAEAAETSEEAIVWLKVVEHNRMIDKLLSDAINRQLASRK